MSTVPHHGANSGCRSAATGPRTSGQEPSALSCGGELFTAGTLVLLASGKTVPISQLKTGDTVLASDTKSGKDQPETVTGVLVHHDTDLHLKTPDGQAAVVVGGSVPAVRDGWMWDLTVPGNNDHDFYVAVAATAVLVHNCGDGTPGFRHAPRGLAIFPGSTLRASRLAIPRRSGITRCSAMMIFWAVSITPMRERELSSLRRDGSLEGITPWTSS